MKTFFPISLLAVPALAMGELPMMCLSNPPLELEAGVSLVSAKIYNPLARRCTASLIFDDTDFLPVTYAFESARCTGTELASFLVPLGAPDGDAYISWRCAGQSPTCIRAVISGGQADTSLDLQDNGAVSCILETLQTMTTLTTVTRSSTTVVESLVSIFTSVTTSPVTEPTTTSASTPTTLLASSAASTTPSASSSMSSSPSTVSNESNVSPTADPPPAGSQPAPAPSSDSSVDHGWPVTTTSNSSTTATTPVIAQSAVDTNSRSAFPPTSDAAALSPSIAAVTLISTVTVMQTMTSVLTSACASA